MDERITQHGAHRLGFMIPMVFFVLFFVVCCGTLVSLFVRSADISAQAGQRSDAVQICRNQAELFRSGASEAERKYFDADYHSAAPENAVYYLDTVLREEDTAVGTMVYAAFTVCDRTGQSLYTLDAARYVPEGR